MLDLWFFLVLLILSLGLLAFAGIRKSLAMGMIGSIMLITLGYMASYDGISVTDRIAVTYDSNQLATEFAYTQDTQRVLNANTSAPVKYLSLAAIGLGMILAVNFGFRAFRR